MKSLTFGWIIITAFWSFGQEKHGIKDPGRDIDSKCKDYLAVYNKLPPEVRYSEYILNGMIYFYMPSEHFFNLLFDNKNDGIAIDIVKRNQLRCYEKNKLANSSINIGHLMPPVYLSELKDNLYIQDGYVIIPYRKLPPTFNPEEIELNLLIIQKKFLCSYHTTSNIDFTNWKILEMGMYKDSLSTNKKKQIETSVSKRLKFTIPFEKNRSAFEKNDIQPLYDSLQLTDYNIKEINIRAYTSIEGSEEQNISLQQQRANSIVEALQQYQKPEIKSTVVAKENWVEFMNDIQNSKFEYLLNKSKEEIKFELEKKSNDLEAILASHRKAIIELDLQKKFTEEENNPILLKKYFDQSIKDEKIEEAQYLQEIILEKINDEQLPDEFISKLEVPQESIYGPLLNNFGIFSVDRNSDSLYDNIATFERLQKLLPGNKKVLYNLTALKIKAWREGEFITNEGEIKNLIEELRKIGLEKSLSQRLWINYNMILAQYKHQENDYKRKNLALKNVYASYRKLDLEDNDLLSLAKYVSWHSKFDWAENIVSKRVLNVDASEDLIFYYIKLTIRSPKKTRQADYKIFIFNAMDKNNQRFCDIFLPKSQGGVTFQLLRNESLRKIYCENCNYSSFQ